MRSASHGCKRDLSLVASHWHPEGAASADTTAVSSLVAQHCDTRDVWVVTFQRALQVCARTRRTPNPAREIGSGRRRFVLSCGTWLSEPTPARQQTPNTETRQLDDRL
eukprot:1535405-Rhodomonas_salina.2